MVKPDDSYAVIPNWRHTTEVLSQRSALCEIRSHYLLQACSVLPYYILSSLCDTTHSLHTHICSFHVLEMLWEEGGKHVHDK